MNAVPVIAVTSGEPAGIGPELCLRLAEGSAHPRFSARLVVLGDKALLAERARLLGVRVTLRDWRADASPAPKTLDVLHVVDEALAGLAVVPATGILQRLRQVPVVERWHGLDAALQQRIDQPRVMVEAGGIRRAAPIGLDPRPRDREAVGART